MKFKMKFYFKYYYSIQYKVHARVYIQHINSVIQEIIFIFISFCFMAEINDISIPVFSLNSFWIYDRCTLIWYKILHCDLTYLIHSPWWCYVHCTLHSSSCSFKMLQNITDVSFFLFSWNNRRRFILFFSRDIILNYD